MSQGLGAQRSLLGQVSAQPSSPQPLQELAQSCDVDRFACGKPTLDDWLKRRARAAEGKTARTYVVLAGSRIAAYYCVSTGAVSRADWPKKFQRNMPDPIPVLLLGRLAVDQDFQGHGLGADLLLHCLRQSLAVAAKVGTRACVVHPLDVDATRFYAKYGFLPMAQDSQAMFLPIETIAKAFR